MAGRRTTPASSGTPEVWPLFSLATRRQDIACTRCDWKPQPGGFWPSLGGVAVRWFRDNLIFGEGDYFGMPFEPLPDQRLFLYAWYEFCPDCDQWRYSNSLRMEATGGGKTQFVAGIAALEFAGPEEIAPTSPNIPVAAASFEQADLIFANIVIMFGGKDDEIEEAPLCGLFNVYDTEIKRKDGRPGRIYRVASVAGTNEGGKPHLFLCDELHEWGDLGSNRARVHTVISTKTTKRHMTSPDRGCGRVLNISTAGFDKEKSLLGTIYQMCQKYLREPELNPRYLVDIKEARPNLDFDKREHRVIACQDASPAAGVIWDISDRVDQWGTMENHEWIRYYANAWPEINEDSWLKDHPQAWEHCYGTWESDTDANPWVIAVDMALRHDSVAVLKVEKLPDGRFAVTPRIWRAQEYGGRIPHDEVWRHIREMATGRGFRGVVYDPRFFEVPARMLEDDHGVLVLEFSQSPEHMAPACGLAYKLIINGQVVHPDDEDLNRHVKAAVAMPQERGGFTLKKGKSKTHIDGAVSMCMGIRVLHEAPTPAPPKPMFAFG